MAERVPEPEGMLVLPHGTCTKPQGTEGASGRFTEEDTVASAWYPDCEGAWMDAGSEFIAVVLIQAPLFTET